MEPGPAPYPNPTPPPKTPQPIGGGKGLLSGLFRSFSLKAKGSKNRESLPRRVSETNARRRPPSDPVARATRRQKRTVSAAAAAAVKPEQVSGNSTPKSRTSPKIPGQSQSTPVSRRNSLKKAPFNKSNGNSPKAAKIPIWPPKGVAEDTRLSRSYAVEWIMRGAPIHRGHRRHVPNGTDDHFYMYTTTADSHAQAQGQKDMVSLHTSMTQLMTMRIQGTGYATTPWETLEQPSYAFFYGRIPGTITFNQWACRGSDFPLYPALRDSGIAPRKMNLDQVMERLRELQSGLEEHDGELLYKILYRRILRDPDKLMNPHKTLDRQITDLIQVLSRPDWIDFTNPRNQVVTKFIFNRGRGGDNYANGSNDNDKNEAQYHRFMHQLLLGLELELRIHSKQHRDWAKEKLMQQMPPSIKWTLALARRWKEFVRVEDFGMTSSKVKLRYKLKRRQVKLLKKFAQTMKWPNLNKTLQVLKQRDDDLSLDTISSDAFAFFSGLVMPGPTFPFLIMNTLIDLDPDPATDALALLSHMHPQCGFQYRNSHTYWSASSIMGKVLAPTCNAVAGWIGPCRPTNDLGRNQIARIRTKRPKQIMVPEDVECIEERSDALGPAADVYPVSDYSLTAEDVNGDMYRYDVDVVRVEMVGFVPVERDGGFAAAESGAPGVFDAKIQFAIDGVSWPLSLAYDVSFVTAWPCTQGPHPLFFDYAYQSIKVDEVIGVRDWGGLYGRQPTPPPHGEEDEIDDEKVLVVDARGVRDNEVLARAWCSHWGLSSIVADTSKTWYV